MSHQATVSAEAAVQCIATCLADFGYGDSEEYQCGSVATTTVVEDGEEYPLCAHHAS
jgi:hypothetical protein